MRPHGYNFNKNPISNNSTLVKAKAKSSDEIARQIAEFEANGGEIEKLACSLDNGCEIKARMGDNGGLL